MSLHDRVKNLELLVKIPLQLAELERRMDANIDDYNELACIRSEPYPNQKLKALPVKSNIGRNIVYTGFFPALATCVSPGSWVPGLLVLSVAIFVIGLSIHLTMLQEYASKLKKATAQNKEIEQENEWRKAQNERYAAMREEVTSTMDKLSAEYVELEDQHKKLREQLTSLSK